MVCVIEMDDVLDEAMNGCDAMRSNGYWMNGQGHIEYCGHFWHCCYE